ncbi:MAG: response regulator [Deltaproteobacteria bacterium]|nr:response regulator [Deltaproteobacteria bacterium]
MESPSVLIVDDSSFIRSQITRVLEQMGAVVTQAEHGESAINITKSKQFDLVITDIEMPVMDGFQLCSRLKEDPHTRTTPVIILSSLDSDRDVDKGFQAGAAAYVSKAEAKNLLMETVQNVLNKSVFHRDQLILVVDDSDIIRSLAKAELEKAGFQVLTALTGKHALKLIKNHRPDLILSDINMPEMDGIEFCKALKKDPGLSAIPIIFMSTNDDRSIMRRMLHLGASAYLVKPFNLEQMVITVEKLLSDHFLLLLKEKERLDTERKMMLASITSLVFALEARDHYTRGHSESVAMLVTEMAKQMDMPQDNIELIGIAGRLHDLGKIGVPDSVLLKPGRLTDAEFDLIKQHPVTGATILGSIPSLEHALPAIRYHHERFDGNGYPERLKGTTIPLWARMMAVADTYDALTSDRPYRKGMSRDKALEIIISARSTQLCPECVDVFLGMINIFPENNYS